MQTQASPHIRDLLVRPMLALVLAAQVLHLLVLVLVPRPLIPSNYVQLACQLLAVCVCLQQRAKLRDAAARRSWLALALAFAIWSAAQAVYLTLLYLPLCRDWPIRPDDALWVLFGLPLLIASGTSRAEADHVGWLDRLQAGLFFAVLYLLVFLPSIRLNLDTTFVIQDGVLLLCCVLRLPTAATEGERRFFVRLSLFLLVYAPLTILGDLLHRYGWPAGSMVDLVWTLPTTFLNVLVLRDAMSSREREQTSRIVQAVRDVQGLSISVLAFLSVGISAFLATRRPLLGSLSVAGSFVLFALRTNARERAWHQAHGRLEETVLQDALTGLGNRTQLRNSLEERLAIAVAGRTTVLIFVDLDRFKSINDSLGHALGDQLLIEVAERLRDAAPAASVVCRHGGDEFVILTTARGQAEAEAAGTALLNALREPMELDGNVLCCTASIGVVLAAVGESADSLLRTADHAMYRAKQMGKDCVKVFDAGMRAQMSSRWQMEQDLRTCLESNGMEVAFQPILSVEGGAISGFEALARWSHPVQGAVPPAEFIPLAEETGLILLLGAQVLEKACRQVAAWNRSWDTELSLSVNVSPRQFADANLLQTMLDTLNRTGLSPSLLRLEITESALLVHESTVKHTLTQARAHGIRISLDDFGTGYSSLAFLLSLPVDEVKVDRSFVNEMYRDPQRRELVRTVVHLGQSLGKRVVAEGVETEQDLRELAAMGCECAQGWLICRPLLAQALEADMASITARNAQSTHMAHWSPQATARPQPTRRTEGWREVLLTPAAALETTS